MLSSADEVLAHVALADAAIAEAEQAVAVAVGRVVDRDVREQLRALPLESLRGAVDGRVAWAALLDAGYRTVAEVAEARPGQLMAIDGVGAQSAQIVMSAATEIEQSLRNSIHPVLRHDSHDERDVQLLNAVVQLDGVIAATRSARGAIAVLSEGLPRALPEAAPARTRLRWLVSRGSRRHAAERAIDELETLLADHGDSIRRAARMLPTPNEDDSARQAYMSDPARFQAVLDSRFDHRRTTSSELSQELVDAISAFPLDVSGLRVMLRRYQEFGAKFILQQRRVLLGDDMGLGKTVQALAAIAHLSTHQSGFRVLLVVPASVLVNWQREIAARTDLVSVDSEEWTTAGGVLVTTYERLKTVSVPAGQSINLLVVDEAHYIKNPGAQRTQRIKALLDHSERVLLMTGTAIENRGDEFVDLVRLLDPSAAARLTGPAALLAPQEFRARVAPLYLRRNADEVLSELPDLIRVDEWEEMTNHDFEHYRRAVAEGNLMAMRRAGFMAGAMRRSAKLDRLLELVADARAAGHKIIIYSYFLDVLSVVAESVSGPVFGPLTGASTSTQRQALVDSFTAGRPGSVLVSQIVAGGVGLNIQTASVVILCEPQFKPSTENQAISRAHRMGQLKPVHVHRLLNPDSIDERVLEILADKEAIFRDYAAASSLADAASEAIDSRVALRLVSDERRRLGIPE